MASFSSLTQSTDQYALKNDDLSIGNINIGTSSHEVLTASNNRVLERNSYYCLLIKEYSSPISSISTSPSRQSTTVSLLDIDSNNNHLKHHNSYTLNIVDSNASDIQKLAIKSFILSKSSKNMIYKTGSIGRIDSNLDTLDINTQSTTTKNIISCYYTLIEIESNEKRDSLSSSIDNQNNQNNQSNNNKQSFSLLDLEDLDLTIPTSPSNENNNNQIDNQKLLKDIDDIDLDLDLQLISENDKILKDIEDLDFGLSNQQGGDEEEDNIDVNTYGMKEYYLCLCYEHSENEPNKIEPFHLELGDFCNDVGVLIKESNQEKLTSLLSNWYSISINYMPRVIDLFKDKLQYIIHASLSGYGFDIKCSNSDAKDIINFIRAITIINLSTKLISQPLLNLMDQDNLYHYNLKVENSTDAALLQQENTPDLISITIPEANVLNVNYNVTNTFCKKWCKRFLDHKYDCLYLRNLSEDIKLKVIQELNMFRRMVDTSKFNNYMLYKCFLFLSASECADIMLYLLNKDSEESTKDLISILSLQIKG